MHRPYPNRDRALHQLDRRRSAYQRAVYAHVPQRIVLGIDALQALAENLRRAQPSGAQLAATLAGHKRPT